MHISNYSLEAVVADNRSILLIDEQHDGCWSIFAVDRLGNYQWAADASSLEESKMICELRWPNLEYRID